MHPKATPCHQFYALRSRCEMISSNMKFLKIVSLSANDTNGLNVEHPETGREAGVGGRGRGGGEGGGRRCEEKASLGFFIFPIHGLESSILQMTAD